VENVENLENKVSNLEIDVLELENIVRPGKVPASCDEYFDRGTIENGQYEIKPNTQIDPFLVYCDFRNLFKKKENFKIQKIIFKPSKSGDQPVTVIDHDHPGYGITSTPGQSDGCDEPGCFGDEINYKIEMEKIISIIEISQICQQRIINNCTGNGLSNFAWWTDRNGNQVQYWDGDHPQGTEGCKCSLDGPGCNENAQGDSVRD